MTKSRSDLTVRYYQYLGVLQYNVRADMSQENLTLCQM